MQSSSTAKHIPSKVLDICFEYVYTTHILFCLIAAADENVKISAIQALDVNNIYRTQYKTSDKVNIGWDTNGLCIHSSHINFPSCIKQKFRSPHHTIFKVGSKTSR